jgi:hypothetical protein
MARGSSPCDEALVELPVAFDVTVVQTSPAAQSVSPLFLSHRCPSPWLEQALAAASAKATDKSPNDRLRYRIRGLGSSPLLGRQRKGMLPTPLQIRGDPRPRTCGESS